MVLGLTFATPALLTGLWLAGVPLLIHLFFRRRHREMDWAAMTWLLEAVKKQYRRMRLEQWLILALRTLIVLAVALAMARPTLEAAAGMLAPTTTAVHHLLLFDNSMSMQHRLAGASRWERAKSIAGSILDDARSGDVASVVVMGSPTVSLVADPSPYLTDVGKEIDGIKPQHAAAKIEPAVDQALEILKKSTSSRRRVFLLTDMQKSAWVGTGGGADAALGDKLRALAERAEVTILDVGGEGPNQAVIDVEHADALAVRGRPTLYKARVANHSSTPANLKAELAVDGQVEATQPVSIAPGETASVNFDHSFREAGDHVVEVRIPDDALTVDDRRRLITRVRPSLSVLIIDGEPAGEPFASESDYLRVALSPDEKNTPLMKVEVRQESELPEARLEDFDLVILANVGQFTATEASLARAYLERGGGLAFFLGGRVNAAAYNQVLYADGKGILPARLGDIAGSPTKGKDFFNFDPRGYRSRVVEPFRDAEGAGLLTAKIFRYQRATLPAESAAEVVLGYRGSSDPAVMVANVGRGAVALVTTSADLEWNNWAISPSFVPVVQELARRLVAGRVTRPSVICGDPIALPLPREGIDIPITITPPDAEAAVPVRVATRENVKELEWSETDLSGVYRVSLGPPVEENWPVAVNPPVIESDLARVSGDDLKSMYPGWKFQLFDHWRNSGGAGSAGVSVAGELARSLLYLALVGLLGETLLAWRFGHHA